MEKANQDIRQYMSDRGVSQRALAAELGISQTSLCQQMKKELSQKDKEMWLNMVDAIVHETKEQFAEEAVKSTESEEDVTVTTKFTIGDRVKIPSKQDTIGVVSDIWSSLAQTRTMYEVTIETSKVKALYAEEQLELAPIPTSYSFDAVIDGNVAVVTMNATQGDKTWVYARGHAHILHDGEVGMAQAVSYAARRMFEALDKKQENKIYFKD